MNRIFRFWKELKRKNVVRRNAVYAGHGMNKEAIREGELADY